MEWLILGLGVFIAGVAIFLIWKKIEISMGHAAVFAVGAVLICAPLVSTLEYSNGGVKVTTKTETLELADKVEAVAEENERVRKDLLSLTESTKAVIERVAVLEQSVPVRPVDPAQVEDWNKLTGPAFIDGLLTRGNTGVDAAAKTLEGIESFKDSLQQRSVPLQNLKR